MGDWRRISFYIFIVALPLSLALGYGSPRWEVLRGETPGIPGWASGWMLITGVVAALATPGAWRWIYRRRD